MFLICFNRTYLHSVAAVLINDLHPNKILLKSVPHHSCFIPILPHLSVTDQVITEGEGSEKVSEREVCLPFLSSILEALDVEKNV